MTTPTSSPHEPASAPPRCELCGDAPNAEVLYLHARCHLTAPLEVSREGDVLTLRCYVPECRREVAKFRILTPKDIEAAGEARAVLNLVGNDFAAAIDEATKARALKAGAALLPLESRVV